MRLHKKSFFTGMLLSEAMVDMASYRYILDKNSIVFIAPPSFRYT